MKIRKDSFIVFIILLLSALPNRYISQLMIVVISFFFFIGIVKNGIGQSQAILRVDSGYFKIIFCFWLILILGFFASLFSFTSFNNLIWYLFNLLPVLLVGFVFVHFKYADLLKGGEWFLYLQTAFLTLQFLILALSQGSINIYTNNQSAGDLMVGTLGAFSTPLSVIGCMFALLYGREYLLTRNAHYLKITLLAFIVGLLPGAMSILLVFICAVIISFFVNQIFNRTKGGGRLAAALLLFIFLILQVQGNNVDYAFRMLDKIESKGLPFKAYLFDKTFSYGIAGGDIPLIGVGGGNFSSRAAMQVSGEYLGKQPSFIPITPSDYTDRYVTSIFSKSYYGYDVLGFDGGSMVSEPFSQYISIAAENGVLGLLLLIVVPLIMLRVALQMKDLSLLILAFFLMMLLFTNAWLEYVEFCTAFFLVLRCMLDRHVRGVHD